MKPSTINERLRDFFIGDDVAWDEITAKLLPTMTRKLCAKFENVPHDLLEAEISDWFTEIFFNVRVARLAGKTDIEKIELCQTVVKFDLSRNTPFDNWAWRVLCNKAIDLYRDLSKENANIEELNENHFYEVDFDNDIANADDEYNQGSYFHEDELEGYRKFLLDTISQYLTDEERIYFEIWLEKGPDPNAQDVIKALRDESGETYSDPFVSKLKKRFLVKSYLALCETSHKASETSSLFRRFVQSDEMQKLFYPIMLENSWKVFVAKVQAVIEVERLFAKTAWQKLFNTAQNGRQKIEARAEILPTAYWHHKKSGSHAEFCQLVEFYAGERFGGEIKKLFFGKK